MNNIEKLIIKKWSGSASKEELANLDELTSSLTEIEREAYQKLETYWKSEGQDTPEVNQTQLWNRLENFIDDQQAQNENKSKKGIVIPIINWKVFSVAASIVVFFTVGYFIWNNYYLELESNVVETEKIEIIYKENLAGEKSTLKLPDGSTVILNSKSKLLIPERFVGRTREVTLEGEAYFDIVSNANMPFIVNTKGAKVKVLGTAFNLKNSGKSDKVKLNVVEGKVQFFGINEIENLIVVANQAASLNKTTGRLSSRKFNSDAIAWSKGELVFNSVSFPEIIERLENWYGVNIEAKRQIILKKTGYSGRFNNSTLEEVLKGISFSVGFDFRIKGKDVIIR